MINYNDFKKTVQGAIQKIQRETSKNRLLEKETLTFSYKAWHLPKNEEITLQKVKNELNYLITPIPYNKVNFYSKIDYIIKLEAAFDKKLEELNNLQLLQANLASSSSSSNNIFDIEALVQERLVKIGQAMSHEEEMQEKMKKIIEQISQKFAYNDGSIMLVGEKINILGNNFCIGHNDIKKLSAYYTSDNQVPLKLRQEVACILKVIQNSLPSFSIHTISQSIRYILTTENHDIVKIALKDSKELGLKIKDENNKDLLAEMQKIEKQIKFVTTNKEKLEKSLDSLSITNSNGACSGYKISHFLNISNGYIKSNAISALSTFIINHYIALTGESIEI